MLVAAIALLAGRTLTGTGSVVAAIVQAVASGVVVAAGLPGRRWVGAVVGGVLLAGVGAEATVSDRAAREALAGLGHAMLYAALGWWFGRSLRPGREAVVTQVARRLNPRFRPGMVPYTRTVTAAWCGFALAQVAASVVLLGVGWWGAWAVLVGGGHAVLAAGMAAGEFAARCWRFPGERTGFWDTVRGFRRRH